VSHKVHLPATVALELPVARVAEAVLALAVPVGAVLVAAVALVLVAWLALSEQVAEPVVATSAVVAPVSLWLRVVWLWAVAAAAELQVVPAAPGCQRFLMAALEYFSRVVKA
jgi:hypothetical protein